MVSKWHCPLCNKRLVSPVIAGCGHTFCWRCLCRHMEHSLQCPECRKTLDYEKFVSIKGFGKEDADLASLPPLPQSPASKINDQPREQPQQPQQPQQPPRNDQQPQNDQQPWNDQQPRNPHPNDTEFQNIFDEFLNLPRGNQARDNAHVHNARLNRRGTFRLNIMGMDVYVGDTNGFPARIIMCVFYVLAMFFIQRLLNF